MVDSRELDYEFPYCIKAVNLFSSSASLNFKIKILRHSVINSVPEFEKLAFILLPLTCILQNIILIFFSAEIQNQQL